MLAGLAQYPAFQVFLTLSLSVVLVAMVTPLLIRFLLHRDIGQQIRAEGIQEHLTKHGTPTMGGIVVVVVAIALFTAMVAFAHPVIANASPARIEVFNTGVRAGITVLMCMLGCGILGFVDDYIKVAKKRSMGLSARAKIAGQVIIATGTTLAAINWVGVSANIYLPITENYIPLAQLSSNFTMPAFLGSVVINVPWVYLLFALVMIVGLTNAVNLTDGLDGLAAGTVTIVSLVFAAIAYASGSLPIAIAATAIAGGCIGFLWWNCYPAKIFMGDTGSLALGGAIAALALVTKTELLVVIIGGIFVVEALSVVIQVLVFKMTGKRVFKMAPIHHHFEMLGWSETTIMVRFCIITGCLAAFGFALFFYQLARFGAG
ncbi:MAG: phospho-N-acetylmuramoyl-pentapeptide-transferase [Coriobacteriia bacterium]|nr:phospho-N-acetylmuramoyl-pentapeptide-transferase [Coriobacteriia bacterium]